MPNYDEIKKKAKDALETIADVSVEAYKIAEEKAKVLARKARLNVEIAHEKTVIKRLRLDIGGIYYDLHKDDPEEALKEKCDCITASLDSIAAKRAELEDLKRSNKPPADDEECGCDAEECCPDAEESGPAPVEEEPAPAEEAPAQEGNE